jgi:hypothetical protein
MKYRITAPNGERFTAQSIEQFHALVEQLIIRFGEDAEFIVTAVIADRFDSVTLALETKIKRAENESSEKTA